MSKAVESKPKDPRAMRSRAALRSTLLSLVEEKPFEQITVREVAERAGVSSPTFYRQYPTKEALLDDIAAEEIHELLAITMPLMEKKDARVSAAALCQFVQARKPLWRTLLTTGATAVLREEFITSAREIALSGERMNPGLPLDLMAPFVVSGIFEILAWWLRQPAEISADAVAQVVEALVIRPSITRQKIKFALE